MFLNMGDEGGLIWQNRSKQIVTFLPPLLITSKVGFCQRHKPLNLSLRNKKQGHKASSMRFTTFPRHFHLFSVTNAPSLDRASL